LSSTVDANDARERAVSVKRGFSEVAVRIEQCETFPGGEVLSDQVEKESALTGAGLPNHIEVSSALVVIEQHIARPTCGRRCRAADLMQSYSQNGAGVPCAPQVGNMVQAAPSFPLRVRRGYMASRRCA
jgi:hypothetical protein